jgi:hypothetical protein
LNLCAWRYLQLFLHEYAQQEGLRSVTWKPRRSNKSELSGDALTAKHFTPFGFTPDRIDTTGPAKLFARLGRLGYALFHSADGADSANPEGRAFELDASILEALGDADLTREWREIDEALSDVRGAGRCLCQLCAPGLDLSRFDLSLVRRLR